jgi:cytoskeleton protein RodZ
MRQRLDIADVETRTKIRAKYLRALENEEFGLLPGSTFVRTFLRTYAEVLGLDPHVLVEEYRTNFEPREEQLEVPIGPSPAGGDGGGGGPGRERRYPGGAPGRGTVIVAAVVGLLIGLVILGVTAGNEDNKGKKSAQTTDKQKRKKRKRKPKPLPAAVTLKVTPTTPTYVCVDNGPGTTIVYQGILQQERTFKAKKIRVNLGKSSVELKENGKPVQFQQTANPVGFEFSPTGHKALDTGQRPCASPSQAPGTTTGA